MLLRLRILIIFFAIAFAGLFSRLYYWQIIKGPSLSVMAQGQHKGVTTLSSPRGEILAHDGSWLAATVNVWLLFATPKDFEESDKTIAKKLSWVLVPEDIEE